MIQISNDKKRFFPSWLHMNFVLDPKMSCIVKAASLLTKLLPSALHSRGVGE